jgi:hypothetical protein
LSDLIKVLDPKYKPQNEYERILRWLGYLDKLLNQNFGSLHNIRIGDEFKQVIKPGLSDGELEIMARFLATAIERKQKSSEKQVNMVTSKDQQIVDCGKFPLMSSKLDDFMNENVWPKLQDGTIDQLLLKTIKSASK